MGDKCDGFARLPVDVEATVSAGGQRDDVPAGVCSRPAEGVAAYDWAGFYIADEVRGELTPGPYAGRRTDHVRIPYGRGILRAGGPDPPAATGRGRSAGGQLSVLLAARSQRSRRADLSRRGAGERTGHRLPHPGVLRPG